MTILSSHPIELTARVIVLSRSYRGYRSPFRVPMLRRLAGLTLRGFAVDVLRNNARIVRADWDQHFSMGTLTLAIVRRG